MCSLGMKSVKALVSVGGWDGGILLSSNVGDATNRTAFVKSLVDMVSNYSLDGIDFEYVARYYICSARQNSCLTNSYSLAGSIPTGQDLVAIPYPLTTRQTSSRSSKNCATIPLVALSFFLPPHQFGHGMTPPDNPPPTSPTSLQSLTISPS